MDLVIDRSVIVLGHFQIAHAVIGIIRTVVVNGLAFDTVHDHGAAAVRRKG